MWHTLYVMLLMRDINDYNQIDVRIKPEGVVRIHSNAKLTSAYYGDKSQKKIPPNMRIYVVRK